MTAAGRRAPRPPPSPRSSDQPSDRHERSQLLELGFADASYVDQLLDRGERSEVLAVGDDRGRCGRAHPRQGVESRLVRRVEVHRSRARPGGPTARPGGAGATDHRRRSEEHTSELQSLMRISYAVSCLKKKINISSRMHRLYTYKQT